MPIHVFAFVATVALLAVIPGANNAAVTRQTLVLGRRAGLLTVAGTSTGILVWALSAAAGLSALVLTVPAAYTAIRLGGAVVLVVLGARTLWQVRRGERGQDVVRTGNGKGFALGVATSLGNPKAGVFALALLPQFVTAHGPVVVSSILLGVVWATVSGSWFCVYVWAVDRGRALAGGSRVERWLQAVTGVTMLGLAAAVACGV